MGRGQLVKVGCISEIVEEVTHLLFRHAASFQLVESLFQQRLPWVWQGAHLDVAIDNDHIASVFVRVIETMVRNASRVEPFLSIPKDMNALPVSVTENHAPPGSVPIFFWSIPFPMFLKFMAAFDHFITPWPVLVLYQIDPPVRLKYGAFRERIYIGDLFVCHSFQIMVNPFVLTRRYIAKVFRLKSTDCITIVIPFNQNSSGAAAKPLDHFGRGCSIVYHVSREAEKDDPEKLQNFVNSWLAEPWEDTNLKTSADLVLERQTHLPELIVPAWAKLLTGGVDVQENCVYWTIRAWGNHIRSQNIAHGQALSLEEVERVMNLSYQREDGGGNMVVNLALIDSGDQTDMVYDFCAANSEWALPGKGASTKMYTHYRMSKVNKPTSRAYGMDLVLVDTDKYKDMIAGRMRKKIEEKGSWTVYADCDREYAEQVTAEHKVNVKKGGRTVQEWVQKHSHGDNHYLECEVYAMCAADIMDVRFLYLEDEAEKPAGPAPAATPEEDWIKAHENWI